MNGGDRLPSPSAARLGGDDFQHIITWIELLGLLESDSVRSVGFEVGQAKVGVVDDLIVRRNGERPDRYAQIKFAVADTTPLSHEWFTTAPRKGADSPLQRFYSSYRGLSEAHRPAELELITNRQTATGDPVLRHRQGLDGTLVPRFFASTDPETVAARTHWAEHLQVEEQDMRAFLAALVLSISRGTIDDLLRIGRGTMALVGLRGDEEAMIVAVGLVRRLIEEGTQELDRAAMWALVSESGLHRAPAYSTLVVQEIEESPLASLAPASVDWVELFDGESPNSRRATIDPGSWEAVMRPDLRRAIVILREVGGKQTIRLEGAYRLPTAFIAGFELNERTGIELVLPYGGAEWNSSAARETAPIELDSHEIGLGSDLALAVGISAALAGDVESYLRAAEVPVASLLDVVPAGGPSRESVSGAGQARALAEAIVDACRGALNGEEGKVHLFLAAPRPMVTMLGRVWNRLPPTRVYADLNPGYAPTYEVEA